MKLYFSPGACSLADHIAMHEAGMDFEHEAVDLHTKTTASGADYNAIGPKGYVPLLALDDGETLSENIAILDWVACQAPAMMPGGAMGRSRLLEVLAFISTEVHKSFKPLFVGGSDDEKAKAKAAITKRLDYMSGTLQGDYLFGMMPTPADAYLFTMLTWCDKHGITVPAALQPFQARMLARPATQTAMRHEGLIQSPA